MPPRLNARSKAILLHLFSVSRVIRVPLQKGQASSLISISWLARSRRRLLPTLAHALRGRMPQRAVIVSPDTGRVAMAADYAHRLGGPVAILHKRRTSGTETAVTHVVGDVRDRPCLIIDDMITTGGTIARAE